MQRKYSLIEMLPVAGGVLGLAAGLYIGLLRFGIGLPAAAAAPDAQPPSGDSAVGQLAFLLVFTLPFVISLLAIRSKREPVRAVIWIGTGLMAWVGAIVPVSVVARLLFPLPGALVLVSGVVAFLRPEVQKSLAVLVLALGLVVLGGASFSTLFTEETPVCWAQLKTASGASVWEERPAGTTAPIILNDPGVGEVTGWTCTSDVISSSEGWYSFGVWMVGLAVGWFLLNQRGFAG